MRVCGVRVCMCLCARTQRKVLTTILSRLTCVQRHFFFAAYRCGWVVCRCLRSKLTAFETLLLGFQLPPNEFLNIDTVLEAALIRCVVFPLKAVVDKAFVALYTR